MATIASPPAEERIVLHDVSWETYERLLADHVDRSVPHFTYDRGELEIASPSTEHEEDNRTLALLIEIIAMEWEIDIRNVGSMTFKRHDLRRGFEPDSSFYVQHEPLVRGKAQIDLEVDPPPDLIVEIEVSRSAIPRLPMYAEMGVPEVWRSEGARVSILRLDKGGFVAAKSAALPSLSSERVSTLLAESRTLARTAWLRRVRDWARTSMPR
jgi:Uma2 family endonuclease